jgi:hypothetical protein
MVRGSVRKRSFTQQNCQHFVAECNGDLSLIENRAHGFAIADHLG